MDRLDILDHINNVYYILDNCLIVMKERLSRISEKVDLEKIIIERDGLEESLNMVDYVLEEIRKIS